MKWFNVGDRNTKFFHGYARGRWKRLHLHEIENDQGFMLKDTINIEEEAVKVFEAQFKKSNTSEDFSMWNCIPTIVIEN